MLITTTALHVLIYFPTFHIQMVLNGAKNLVLSAKHCWTIQNSFFVSKCTAISHDLFRNFWLLTWKPSLETNSKFTSLHLKIGRTCPKKERIVFQASVFTGFCWGSEDYFNFTQYTRGSGSRNLNDPTVLEDWMHGNKTCVSSKLRSVRL